MGRTPNPPTAPPAVTPPRLFRPGRPAQTGTEGSELVGPNRRERRGQHRHGRLDMDDRSIGFHREAHRKAVLQKENGNSERLSLGP